MGKFKQLLRRRSGEIRWSLFSLIGLLCLTLSGILAYTLLTIYDQRLDATIVDLAGRQRMLLERHQKEIFLVSQGIPANFQNTRNLLNQSCEVLRHGGEAMINFEAKELVSIPPAPTKAIVELLDSQKILMGELIRQSDEFLHATSRHQNSLPLLQDMLKLSGQIQGAANATVKLFSRHSQEKIKHMMVVELLMGLIAMTLGIFLARQIKNTNEELMQEVVERSKVEDTLRYRIQIEQLVTNLSTQFITRNTLDLDAEIDRALSAIGKFCGLDRCFLFQIDQAGSVAKNSHMWCRSGIPQPRMFSHEYLLTDWSWFGQQLAAHRLIQIVGLEGLPPEAARERLEFQRQSIQSLVIVPLLWRGQLEGYLRFDAVRQPMCWSDEDIRLLYMSGEILVNALERKRMETELQLREQETIDALRQSDRLKSALLSLVSHELRTPLTAIKTAVSGLMNLHTNGHSALSGEVLSDIHVEIDYLNGLIENLLDMSRVETGNLNAQPEWHLLEDLVEGAVRQVRVLLQGRDLCVDVGDNLPPVFVDGMDIQRVLVNLLDNAVKYSKPGSDISLCARVEPQRVEVTVTNTSGFVLEEDISRIFERFYRMTHVQVGCIRGTGLGLSICKGIIEAHGGRIEAAVTPPHEFSITFFLPIKQYSSIDILQKAGG
ncbi:MAG: GAF domain-containing protein [Nitrospira sp.]|nr:GAF domain-containing protein [Nitrospira sp.]